MRLWAWLLNVPSTCTVLSQGLSYVDNFTCCHTEIKVAAQTSLCPPVTVDWHQANQSMHRPCNTRCMAGQPLEYQSLFKLLMCFSFRFSSRWHRSARKGPYALHPVSQQSPQGCPRNSANICLVEHRSFSTLEGGMSAASFLHSSFLQAISAVMLWLVHVEKVPQASEHLCPAKLQTRCDISCACQSICPFIPTDSGVPRTVES